MRDKSKVGLVILCDRCVVTRAQEYSSPVGVKDIGERPATGNMKSYAATVTVRKRDGTMTRTVEMIVVTGENYEDMKRSHKNLCRALRYTNLPKSEDALRWVITDIVIHKQLGICSTP